MTQHTYRLGSFRAQCPKPSIHFATCISSYLASCHHCLKYLLDGLHGCCGLSPNVDFDDPCKLWLQTLGDSRSAEYMKGRKTLEINPEHPIVQALKDKVESDVSGAMVSMPPLCLPLVPSVEDLRCCCCLC